MRKSRFWTIKEYLQEENPFPISIIAGRDGRLYQIRNGFLGRLVVPLKEDPTLDQITSGFEMKLPQKIPGKILGQAIAFFRNYIKEDRQYEAMIQIFWDYQALKYVIVPPHQIVSKFRVHYRTQDKFVANERYIQVAQIHSHNTMVAEFSTIDDENELDYLIYGVIGELHKNQPSMKFRVGSQGSFINVPVDIIFEIASGIPDVPYPKEWDELVILGGDVV